MKVSPACARAFYQHYKFIAIIFLIIMVASTYITTIGVYNYVIYGNCNGEDSAAFCVLHAALGTRSNATISSPNLNQSCNATDWGAP